MVNDVKSSQSISDQFMSWQDYVWNAVVTHQSKNTKGGELYTLRSVDILAIKVAKCPRSG